MRTSKISSNSSRDYRVDSFGSDYDSDESVIEINTSSVSQASTWSQSYHLATYEEKTQTLDSTLNDQIKQQVKKDDHSATLFQTL